MGVGVLSRAYGYINILSLCSGGGGGLGGVLKAAPPHTLMTRGGSDPATILSHNFVSCAAWG